MIERMNDEKILMEEKMRRKEEEVEYLRREL